MAASKEATRLPFTLIVSAFPIMRTLLETSIVIALCYLLVATVFQIHPLLALLVSSKDIETRGSPGEIWGPSFACYVSWRRLRTLYLPVSRNDVRIPDIDTYDSFRHRVHRLLLREVI